MIYSKLQFNNEEIVIFSSLEIISGVITQQTTPHHLKSGLGVGSYDICSQN